VKKRPWRSMRHNGGVQTNQFTAKIRFDPIAWRAYDQETGAIATVIDHGGKRVDWYVVFSKSSRRDGYSTTPSGARAACRRAIASASELTTSLLKE
jgi:hypothetical protein